MLGITMSISLPQNLGLYVLVIRSQCIISKLKMIGHSYILIIKEIADQIDRQHYNW